jgi:hypothetical protein
MTITAHNQNAHPDREDKDCFGCKVAGFGIGAKVLVTRNPQLVDRKNTEIEYAKNRPAYERMRRSGLKPKRFTDAATVESRAVSKYEIETGHNFHGDEKKGARADEVQTAIKSGQDIDL